MLKHSFVFIEIILDRFSFIFTKKFPLPASPVPRLPPPTCISVRIVSSLPKTEESLGRTPSQNLLQQTD